MDSASPPPRGRRDNGLSSAEWGALVDLDPRLSEALLDSLAAVGVPAYVEPAPGAVDTVSRAVALPKRPLDRLWVDTTRADEARTVITAEVADLTALLAEEDPGATAHGFVQPVPRTAATKVLHPPQLPEPPARPAAVVPSEPSPTDNDVVWQQLVDSFGKDAAGPVPPWPVSEDVDDRSPTIADEAATSRRLRRRSDPEISEDDALPAWLEPAALEDDGHYVPPPPPPIPKVRRHTVGSLVALTVGLVLVFAPNLLGQVQSVGLGIVGIALMLGGAGALVWHMRDAPPTDRGPDDGAVV
ncbi:MAG: hypothetical protein QOE05_1757 [Actinomycetota bacterium]|jgi:hypothetical protein|nr:hypothetical protein [Actinomycetota bacterium]